MAHYFDTDGLKDFPNIGEYAPEEGKLSLLLRFP